MSETARRQSNKQRVLEALLTGPKTNAELIQLGGFRYGARVDELRRDYDIQTENIARGLFRFVLIGPVKPGQKELPL